MAKREYTLTQYCSHDGCSESRFYVYSTRKSYNEAYKRRGTKYLCMKHDPKAGRLSKDKLDVSGTITLTSNFADASRSPIIADKLFWSSGSGHANGTTTGIRWNADAKDFPPGTKITIETNVRIVLPSEEKSSELAACAAAKLKEVIDKEPSSSYRLRSYNEMLRNLTRQIVPTDQP